MPPQVFFILLHTLFIKRISVSVTYHLNRYFKLRETKAPEKWYNVTEGPFILSNMESVKEKLDNSLTYKSGLYVYGNSKIQIIILIKYLW